MKKVILMLAVSLITVSCFASIAVPKEKLKFKNNPKVFIAEFNFSGKKIQAHFVEKNETTITSPRTWYFPTECKVYAVTFDIEGMPAWSEIALSVMFYIYAQHLCEQEKAWNANQISTE
jgi:hypothetical protein